MKEEKYAVVGIHDVAPFNLKNIKKKKNFLVKQGVSDFSYLIIPFFHGKPGQDIRKNREFIDFFKNEDDLVLHGLVHRIRVRSSEFQRIMYENAADKLAQGIEIFEQAFGYKPSGFIPPAWALSNQGLLAVKNQGFDYTASSKYFYDLKKGKKVRASVVIRGGALTMPSLLRSVFKIESGGVLQIALHPKDNLFKLLIIKKLIKLVKKKGYKLMSYNSFEKVF